MNIQKLNAYECVNISIAYWFFYKRLAINFSKQAFVNDLELFTFQYFASCKLFPLHFQNTHFIMYLTPSHFLKEPSFLLYTVKK